MMKLIFSLSLAVCFISYVACLNTKYIVETGSGFDRQFGMLSLILNGTSGPQVIVDMMPSNDDVTAITEYVVDETDSPITTDAITGAAVRWISADATNTASITIARAQVVPLGTPSTGRGSVRRSYCISDRLQSNRVYTMGGC